MYVNYVYWEGDILQVQCHGEAVNPSSPGQWLLLCSIHLVSLAGTPLYRSYCKILHRIRVGLSRYCRQNCFHNRPISSCGGVKSTRADP
jgi:hypothetical protein